MVVGVHGSDSGGNMTGSLNWLLSGHLLSLDLLGLTDCLHEASYLLCGQAL